MAMGVVSQEDFEAELGSIKELKPRGRPLGKLEVPESVRQEIAETAITEGRAAALDVAKQHGISSSSVSAYTRGATSTASYNNPAKNLIDHINRARHKHSKRASRALGLALSELTPEKLEGVKAKDLASIARDMAGVIKTLEPELTAESGSKPNFVVYAPQFKQENSYEVIDVKEE